MYERLLLLLDGEDIAESAIPHAEMLALRCGTKKVTIVVVSVRISLLLHVGLFSSLSFTYR